MLCMDILVWIWIYTVKYWCISLTTRFKKASDLQRQLHAFEERE